jgi:hypothetical protein
MARGKPVELATRFFATQGEASAYFKVMLGRYQPGQQVSPDDGLDLSALLERHDEYALKVGVGLRHFEVMMTEQGTPCFRIVRTDGSGTDFSYPHCVRGHPPSRKQEVSQAFRRAVRFDLYRARDTFFQTHKSADGLITCAVTHERITPDQGHMDHRPPLTFEVIVTTFLEGRGLSVENVAITSGADEQTAPDITDGPLAEAFRQYHARIAQLDFVKDKINLAQSARNRVKPGRIRIKH